MSLFPVDQEVPVIPDLTLSHPLGGSTCSFQICGLSPSMLASSFLYEQRGHLFCLLLENEQDLCLFFPT